MSGYTAGNYLGRVKSCGYDAYKKTPFFKIVFTVSARFDAQEDAYIALDDDRQYDRNILFWLGNKDGPTDKAAEYFVDRIRDAFGWDGDDLGDLAGDVLTGAEFQVVCRGKDDRGYDIFELPGSGKGAQTAENVDKIMDAVRKRFNRLARKTAATKGRSSKSNHITASEDAPDKNDDDADDDIPF